jgi:SAM-dependent methyltransferase
MGGAGEDARMRQHYILGSAPWDTGRPNQELLRVVEAGLLPGKTLLEFGCGTGTNAIELARRGYQVTAVDAVDVAIDRARGKAKKAGVTVDFHTGDLTELELGGPFDVLFDLGLYHMIRTRNLPGFLRALKRTSRRGTRWLSVAGNARERTPNGPPRVEEEEIRRELGPLFKILDLHEFRLDLGPDFQPLFWSTLLERT